MEIDCKFFYHLYDILTPLGSELRKANAIGKTNTEVQAYKVTGL